MTPPVIDPATAETFVAWLLSEVVSDARGDRVAVLDVAPSGRLWLGRLAPTAKVQNSRLGERAERLEPCEVGLRVLPDRTTAVRSLAERGWWPGASARRAQGCGDHWEKSAPSRGQRPAGDAHGDRYGRGGRQGRVRRRIRGHRCHRARVRVPRRDGDGQGRPRAGRDHRERLAGGAAGLGHQPVRGAPPGRRRRDRAVHPGQPPRLVPLRPPRRGVRRQRRRRAVDNTTFRTTDVALHDQPRPSYWDDDGGPEPGPRVHHSRRRTRSPPLSQLVGAPSGGVPSTGPRPPWTGVPDEGWDATGCARQAAGRRDGTPTRWRGWPRAPACSRPTSSGGAFVLANRAFDVAPSIRHTAMAAVPARLRGQQPRIDRGRVRRRGAPRGGHALVRHRRREDRDLSPLRPDRSLPRSAARQDRGHHVLGTVPAAHALAPADPALRRRARRGRSRAPRREDSRRVLARLHGGQQRHAQPDPDDQPRASSPTTATRTCPLATRSCCAARSAGPTRSPWPSTRPGGLSTTSAGAPGAARAAVPIPFRIVDEEIYRSLPTVVIGTLDKAASISMQAAMRGFYGAPCRAVLGPDHGFTYAPAEPDPERLPLPRLHRDDPGRWPRSRPCTPRRSACRTSCTCCGTASEPSTPTTRRSSTTCRPTATRTRRSSPRPRRLPGRRTRSGSCTDGRAGSFPLPGPAGRALASGPATRRPLARRFAGLAPRGVTLEYATDQLTESLQRAIRRAVDDPGGGGGRDRCRPRGDAASSSAPTAWTSSTARTSRTSRRSPGPSSRRSASTGSTPRRSPAARPSTRSGRPWRRLTDPEPDFYDRIHLVAASSMLSHGVDIDRLNVMVMLGLPLVDGRVHPDHVPGRAYSSRARRRPAQDRSRARRRRVPDVPGLRRSRRSPHRPSAYHRQEPPRARAHVRGARTGPDLRHPRARCARRTVSSS